MKAVISDTSPISYLARIGALEVLPALFGEILVPFTVLAELRHPQAPQELNEWQSTVPQWIRVCRPLQLLGGLNLDAGETEAISLAKEHAGSLLIIDEIKGRNIAVSRGLLVIGTLGVIEEADRKGLLEFESSLQRLRATNFRVSAVIAEEIISRVKARKKKG